MPSDEALTVRVRLSDELPPESEQLAVLVDSMRTSAQETLEALRRRGFVIARVEVGG